MIRLPISKHPFGDYASPVAPLAVALVLCASPVAAQESWDVSRQANPADVSSLDGIIAAFYDVVSGPAEEARDWARDSTLYLPGVRFVVVSRSEAGQLAARNFDHGSWAMGSNASLEQGFYEKEINRVTRQFGPITDVFSTYEWRTSEKGPVGGRGINSIQLFDDGERWWITGAMWTSEDPEHPIPAEYLPD
jgi:hypothetical protein